MTRQAHTQVQEAGRRRYPLALCLCKRWAGWLGNWHGWCINWLSHLACARTLSTAHCLLPKAKSPFLRGHTEGSCAHAAAALRERAAAAAAVAKTWTWALGRGLLRPARLALPWVPAWAKAQDRVRRALRAL